MKKLKRDPNAESFKAQSNGKLFHSEIDALNALRPEDFVTLLEDSVDNHFDMGIYTSIMRDPKYSPGAIRKLLHKAIKKFSKYESDYKANK